MKGSGLPIHVIVLIIIGVLILAAVIIASYSVGGEGFDVSKSQLWLAGNITKKSAEEGGSPQPFGSKIKPIDVQGLNDLTNHIS